jgi:hypothetical protein
MVEGQAQDRSVRAGDSHRCRRPWMVGLAMHFRQDSSMPSRSFFIFWVFNRGSAATRCHKCDLEEVNCATSTTAAVHMCDVLWPCGLESRRPFGFARLWLLALAFCIRGVSVARFSGASGTYVFGIPVRSGGV